MRIPDNITRDQMLSVIGQMDAGTIQVSPHRRSTGYCLNHNGRRYRHFPPKEVIRQANVIAHGNELWASLGGIKQTAFAKVGDLQSSHMGVPYTDE